MKYNLGDTVYIVENNRIIREVKIVSHKAGFCTFKFIGKDGGTRLRDSRVFATKEEAEKHIMK
ncbi:MAG: hypothetical protein Q4B26_17580 [Eubacteriales bacterium]|nr:hypothetical protein [Eubacteriales bacterium]